MLTKLLAGDLFKLKTKKMSFNILDNPLIVQIFEGRKQMHWLKVYQGGKGVIEWKNSSLSDK